MYDFIDPKLGKVAPYGVYDVTTNKLWKYAVLVTNANYALEAIGQLYRDRADCENGFDELKNQRGWGGYTTQELERCKLSARAVALIYKGGAGMCAWPTRKPASKPSPAARFCWPASPA